MIKNEITNKQFGNISKIIGKIAISRGDKERNEYKQRMMNKKNCIS